MSLEVASCVCVRACARACVCLMYVGLPRFQGSMCGGVGAFSRDMLLVISWAPARRSAATGLRAASQDSPGGTSGGQPWSRSPCLPPSYLPHPPRSLLPAAEKRVRSGKRKEYISVFYEIFFHLILLHGSCSAVPGRKKTHTGKSFVTVLGTSLSFRFFSFFGPTTNISTYSLLLVLLTSGI